MTKLIDAARVCPSAANLQPLRYKIVRDPQDCAALFPHLRWAGYLPDGTPKAGQEPTAYIVIAQDLICRKADASIDAGASAMAITLCAQELGIGSCWIGSFSRDAVKSLCGLTDDMQILLIIALGYPDQESKPVCVTDGNIRYYLDDEETLCVPKRDIHDVIL